MVRLNSVREEDDLVVRWLTWYVRGEKVLWLRVGSGLLLLDGLGMMLDGLGMTDFFCKMFANWWRAVIMVVSCSGAHSGSELF